MSGVLKKRQSDHGFCWAVFNLHFFGSHSVSDEGIFDVYMPCHFTAGHNHSFPIKLFSGYLGISLSSLPDILVHPGPKDLWHTIMVATSSASVKLCVFIFCCVNVP